MENKESPDEVLTEIYLEANSLLKRVDKNFIKELLFGSIRWYSKLFWILQKVSKRDLLKVSPEIRAALILGTYQVFYMDRVPDRAAVNESVEYMRFAGQAHTVGFVNGILRSISRKTEYFAKPDKKKQPCDYLSLQYAHPSWVVYSWYRRFGFEKLKSILASNNNIPPVSIRINAKKISPSNFVNFRNNFLREEKTKVAFSHLDHCWRSLKFPQLENGSFFARGYYSIQDESSQLVAHIVDPKANETILDACAGLGGKTSHIFELSPESVRLVALDPSEARRKKALLNFKRLGHNGVEYISSSLLDYQPNHLFDKILLDAPCSGLGVLRRHPEGKWHKKQELVTTLAKKQRKLIECALKLLKNGGTLIYSVCSFELEESSLHMAWVKEAYKDSLEVVNLAEKIPQYYHKYITRDDLFLIYSGNKENMDGFSTFALRKKS